eukprot:1533903-Pleurochrysis_carterae.AAC.1
MKRAVLPVSSATGLPKVTTSPNSRSRLQNRALSPLPSTLRPVEARNAADASVAAASAGAAAGEESRAVVEEKAKASKAVPRTVTAGQVGRPQGWRRKGQR